MFWINGSGVAEYWIGRRDLKTSFCCSLRFIFVHASHMKYLAMILFGFTTSTFSFYNSDRFLGNQQKPKKPMTSIKPVLNTRYYKFIFLLQTENIFVSWMTNAQNAIFWFHLLRYWSSSKTGNYRIKNLLKRVPWVKRR